MQPKTHITQQDIKRLQQTFNAVEAFDQQAFAAMLPHWQVVQCKRKLQLTQTGEVERYLYFVTDGIQRGYCNYLDKDATLVFSTQTRLPVWPIAFCYSAHLPSILKPLPRADC